MDIMIEKKDAFKVAGIDLRNIDSSRCPEAWEILFKAHSFEELCKLGNCQSYGICHDMETEGKLNYMVGYDVKDEDKARSMDLEILEIEAAEYAIVDLKGPVPRCIHEGWKYVMEHFLPEQGYIHSGAPDFEVYDNGDMNSEDYRMKLWVPIKKA